MILWSHGKLHTWGGGFSFLNLLHYLLPLPVCPLPISAWKRGCRSRSKMQLYFVARFQMAENEQGRCSMAFTSPLRFLSKLLWLPSHPTWLQVVLLSWAAHKLTVSTQLWCLLVITLSICGAHHALCMVLTHLIMVWPRITCITDNRAQGMW